MVIKSGLQISTRLIYKPVARYDNPAPLSDRFDFLSTDFFLIGGGAKKKCANTVLEMERLKFISFQFC